MTNAGQFRIINQTKAVNANNEISFQVIKHGTKLGSDRRNENNKKIILTTMDSCDVLAKGACFRIRQLALCAGVQS